MLPLFEVRFWHGNHTRLTQRNRASSRETLKVQDKTQSERQLLLALTRNNLKEMQELLDSGVSGAMISKMARQFSFLLLSAVTRRLFVHSLPIGRIQTLQCQTVEPLYTLRP